MQDLRLAVRALRATPIVTAVAVLSLALGIGVNTTIFSLLNSMLLRRLPVHDATRLVLVTSGDEHFSVYPFPVWEQIRLAAVQGLSRWEKLGRGGSSIST